MAEELPKTILVIGTFDTKAEEHAYLREQILLLGHRVVSVDIGVMKTSSLFPIEVDAEHVATAGGASLGELRSANDRGAAMKTMSTGAAKIVTELHRDQRFDAMIGMGGSGGTSVITSAMRAVPLGVPKICVSTLGGGDTSSFVGSKDIVMIPSITDVAGLNRILRRVIQQSAAAVCGMATADDASSEEDRPIIAASMFGNTTECVNQCREQLDRIGYEVLVFHAVGSGGRMLETLVADGQVEACLDLTTTEWADQICGGIFGAGEDRLAAAGRAGIPHLIAPGCVDMVNFGPIDTVPLRYREANRLFYEWNPDVTLMRTNIDENRQLGKIFAEKANAATGPVAFLLPMKGVSILDGDGERFCDREADRAMFDTLKESLRNDIRVIEVDANINDPVFTKTAVDTMLEMLPS